ncbi:hypothetical protein KEM55_005604, partial [Ascosphaera atra]
MPKRRTSSAARPKPKPRTQQRPKAPSNESLRYYSLAELGAPEPRSRNPTPLSFYQHDIQEQQRIDEEARARARKAEDDRLAMEAKRSGYMNAKKHELRDLTALAEKRMKDAKALEKQSDRLIKDTRKNLMWCETKR